MILEPVGLGFNKNDYGYRVNSARDKIQQQPLKAERRAALVGSVGYNIFTEGSNITGDAHLIEPPAQFHTRDGMILIRFFAQELVQLDELDLLSVLGHDGFLPAGHKYTE